MAQNNDMTELPESFATQLRAQLGDAVASRLLAALDCPPEVSIRFNDIKPESLDFDCSDRVPWCPDGVYLSSRPRFTLDPCLHSGAYYVQDASSMVYQKIVRAIVDESDSDAGLMVADLCAAPGGKTTTMLNALPDGSVVLANEFVATRANALKENLIKYGYPEVAVSNADVGKLAGIGDIFDIVAVDAPCSGEGMMRKEAVARTQWSPGLVAQCAALQRNILSDAVRLVKPGGYLIYSTCTFNTLENEDNAAWISEELGMLPIDTGLSGSFGILPEVKGAVPCIRFLPGFVRGEGLFLALFRRPADSILQTSQYKRNRKKDKKATHASGIDKALLAKASSWIAGDFEVKGVGDRVVAYSLGVDRLLSKMPSDVRILYAGLDVAEVKGRDLVPAHPLAMSVSCRLDAFPKVPLSEDEAVSYLMREPLVLPADTPKGYVLSSYKGQDLGFLKNLGSRSNNLYPQQWRILHR